MTEEWRPVVGFEGLYEVSDRRRVRSVPRRVASGVSGQFVRMTRMCGTVLTPAAGGYVSLSNGRKKWKVTVDRLVALAFPDPLPAAPGDA